MDHVLLHSCTSMSNLPWRGGKLYAGRSESAPGFLYGCITAPGGVTGVTPQQLQAGYGTSQDAPLAPARSAASESLHPRQPQQLSLCSRAQTAVMSCWMGHASLPSAMMLLSPARRATRASCALRRGLCSGRCCREVGP